MASLSITTVIAIAAFLYLLFGMALAVGTQGSFSQLAKQCRWLLLVALWSQVLLLPQMLDMTPQGWQWMPVLGIFAVAICGGASLFNEEDNLTHMIAAAVAFVCLVGWVMLINQRCLMPLIVCVAAGRENPIWRIETGMVASVYTVMII